MRAITMKRVDETRNLILETVCSRTLTHEQKVTALERAAESLIEGFPLPSCYEELKAANVICDLVESNAPPRPRYIVPDYAAFFRTGSAFLQVEPPRDLDEAINALEIMYRHVPSVTNFPVWIGFLDKMLEPFVQDEVKQGGDAGRAAAKKKIALFLRYIDRTITDSFCHGDIGPEETLSGRLILECQKEVPTAVPNISFLYDEKVTPENYALFACETALSAAKPSFANHAMFRSELGPDYAVVSCYNGLPVGGGSFTLTRLRLGSLAKKVNSVDEFWRELEDDADVMMAYMDARLDFMVNDSGFFESNFLSQEGFIDKKRFTAMFGIIGLAECVNRLMELQGKADKRYGHSAEADDLGVAIMKKLDTLVKAHRNPHCAITGGHFLLHGQVGIDTDAGETPSTRIPIGEEPAEITEHLAHCARFHPFFPSGTGDIFVAESTAARNPAYILDLVCGAFRQGARYLTFHGSDSDVIRVTGYLVKRSELEKLSAGNAVLQNTTHFGLGAARRQHILERKRI